MKSKRGAKSKSGFQTSETNGANGVKAEAPPDGFIQFWTKLQAVPMVHITLPPRAEGDDTSNDHTECYVSHTIRDIILNTPGFPQPVPQPTSPAHRVGKSPEGYGPEGGLALYASRDIKQGELVISERPLYFYNSLMIPTTPVSEIIKVGVTTPEQFDKVRHREAEVVREVSFQRMTEENKKTFMELSNSHKEGGGGPLVGIIRTNGFETGLMDPDLEGAPAGYGGVCGIGSRLNHSCRPNVSRHFFVDSFSFRFYALRDIPEGEELTTWYCDIEEPFVLRQAALKRYGFTCTCGACTDPVLSDKRRAMIQPPDKYYRIRNDPALAAVRSLMQPPPAKPRQKELSPEQFVRITRMQIELIQREGMERSEHYEDHLFQLALSLDAKEDAEEIEALKAKANMIRKIRGKEVFPEGGPLPQVA